MLIIKEISTSSKSLSIRGTFLNTGHWREMLFISIDAIQASKIGTYDIDSIVKWAEDNLEPENNELTDFQYIFHFYAKAKSEMK